MTENRPGETTSLFDDDDFENPPEENEPVKRRSGKRPGKFLGMTAFQRFLISIMIMVTACILGTACLLITGKIGLVI